MNPGGTFDLKSPRQLLSKATHDLQRLRNDPTDAYAAFDLFVTLRHIPHWIFPGDEAKARAMIEAHPELRVCRHIADGAKHFVLTAKHHCQVQRTERTSSAWGKSWGKSWGGAWGQDALVIELDPADPGTAFLGTRTTALELGETVVKLLEGLVP